MALSNKVAAIFGAGPGNGAAFAKKFLAQGYVVAVTSRSAEKMADLWRHPSDRRTRLKDTLAT